MPPVKIQIILNSKEKQPPDEEAITTFFPNGSNTNAPILKHCKLKGMPMIVMQRIRPPKKYPSAETKPPKISQSKLPIAFML